MGGRTLASPWPTLCCFPVFSATIHVPVVASLVAILFHYLLCLDVLSFPIPSWFPASPVQSPHWPSIRGLPGLVPTFLLAVPPCPTYSALSNHDLSLLERGVGALRPAQPPVLQPLSQPVCPAWVPGSAGAPHCCWAGRRERPWQRECGDEGRPHCRKGGIPTALLPPYHCCVV